MEGYRQDRAMKQAEGIYDVLQRVFKISDEQKIPTHIASNKIAEDRLNQVGSIRKIYSGNSNYSGRLGELTYK